MEHQHNDHQHAHGQPAPLTRSAVQATPHCLTGCAIGEVLGMVLATAFGWGNVTHRIAKRRSGSVLGACDRAVRDTLSCASVRQ